MTDDWHVFDGNCLDVMAQFTHNVFDAVVTDPPYGLEFMGKEWDSLGGRKRRYKARSIGHGNTGILPMYGRGGKPEDVDKFKRKTNQEAQNWHEKWARAAFRVLKPGGYLLAFGGTRTHHRLMCAIEDAGLEIRDCLMRLYGSGFPKSHDISKAIGRELGKLRKVQGMGPSVDRIALDYGGATGKAKNGLKADFERDDEARTDEAKQWGGYGTALKPAWEPIILAQKPRDGTFANNVLKHGVGGLNIDGCRVARPNGNVPEISTPGWGGPSKKLSKGVVGTTGAKTVPRSEPSQKGRWPANLILDEESGAMLDEQTGDLGKSSGGNSWTRGNQFYGKFGESNIGIDPGYGDSGGASRFFYCAKASRKERGEGNNHPTVKPIALMRYLCKLVRPPEGGVLLDPFCGSGSTLIAALQEGWKVVGIDENEGYCEIARKRCGEWRGQGT